MKLIGKLLKVVGGVVVALVVLALIFGGSSNEKEYSSDKGRTEVATGEATEAAEDDAQEQTQQAEAHKEKYTITDENFDTSDPYFTYITGVLTNNTDRDVTYLQIEYNIYDADGNQIGSAFDNINNLKAGGTWKFKAYVTEEGAASYELADVTGF